MLSYMERYYFQRYLKRIICISLVLVYLFFWVYSCDLDFSFRERYLPDNSVVYPEGIIKTPVSQQNVVYYNKELKVEVVAKMQITGNFLVMGSNVLRTSCPFKKKETDIYNKHFQAIVVSVDNQNHQFSVMAQSRLLKQLLHKLLNDSSFYETKYGHKITLFGYLLKLPEHSDLSFQHIVVTKIILDNKVYE